MSTPTLSPICPHSALRYRPIMTETDPDIPTWTRPTRRRAQETKSVPLAISKATMGKKDPSTVRSSRSSLSLALFVGLGMGLAMFSILVGQLLIGWVQGTLNTWQYGFPRTYQTDAYVGQEQTNQPSHFLAINNHGQIEVIELPGNDPTHAQIFLGPHLVGTNADLLPVTLRFLDPHHTHQPNMLVQFGNSSVLFLNRQGTFQLDQGTA